VFISQLIVAPVLMLEAWLYLQYVRRQQVSGVRIFDYMVIVVAVLACLACVPLVAAHDSGANDRIWHPVLSVLTSFHVFPLVLFLGLWMRGFAARASSVDGYLRTSTTTQ
jgi:hypothetical protein